ncbi:methyl-accepting chemotaxis protein [Caulobacter segnis]|uniref:methyl-accepting chemotaxis protein n=1 Tax=Caulobacter segnis TaxID=88688 RepID=UPI00385775CD
MGLIFSTLEAQRQAGGRLVVALIWSIVPMLLIARLATHGAPIGLAAAALALALASTVVLLRVGEGSLGRMAIGVALMAQLSLLIPALAGHPWQAEMHVTYFAALGLLVIYCDWVVIAAAAAAVMVSQLGLSFFAPHALFEGAAAWGRLIVQAVVVVVEAAALIAVAASVNHRFTLAQQARVQAEAAVGEARAAQDSAVEARRSEEDNRKRHAEAYERAEAQRDAAIAALGQALSHLARGDLTARLHTQFAEAYEALRADYNTAADRLADALTVIESRVDGVRSGSDQIADAVQSLARRTERQAASLQATASTMDDITATVGQTASGAKKAADVVARTRDDAERSGEVVERTVAAMTAIESSSQEITNIIGVIDEIAFQTNLLALNAGIEAARAGESGKGFAVVAMEVRALAQRSAEAAKEVKQLISTSTQHVETGVGLVGRTGEALQRMVTQISEIDALVSEIAGSAQAQAQGLAQVNTSVAEMDQGLRENAGMVEETSEATQTLNADAALLADLVDQFDLPHGPSPMERLRA